MLSLQHITHSFGSRTLFDHIDVLITPGQRVGLAGPNGAGKSTLLKIVAGRIKPHEGLVQYANDETVGYLPQDGVAADPEKTVFEEVESAFQDLLILEAEVKEAQKKLASTDVGTPEYEKWLQKYGHLQHRLEESGAYSLHANIEKVLRGLGFSDDDFSRPVDEFSGGWLMRIALAKLLLKGPTYLLLDEPTNHLDIESLQWIEQFLDDYDGAVIVVSHNKGFLNRICNRTLWLNNGQLEDYSGNYTFFDEKHAERMEHRRKAYENQQQMIKETQEFIERFRYKATKAKQVQSRIKQLEKLDLIELNETDREISFQFPEPERSGTVNMRMEHVNKSYGELQVFDDFSAVINRGDKIAMLGPNGAGKSTLARIMAGIESIDSGKYEAGYKVTISYFAQHQADELDLSQNAFQVMQTANTMATETRIRTILGCFLFQGDDVFKRVSVLSGGEKSRLALARMLLQPANFLIFDEPTNHLDMQSRDILQQALQQYEGTLVIISHDIDFLDPIVKKVLEVRPHETKTYLGNVSYYLEKQRADESGDVESDEENQPEAKKSLSRKDERRIEAHKRQLRYEKIGPYREEFKRCESGIETLEERKADIENRMADPGFYDDSQRVREISMEYNKLKAELVEKYAAWEELTETISRIEEEFAL